MKARIVYDEDGTSVEVVEAERITAQVWRGGRALVKLSNGGVLARTLQYAKIYSIDIDRSAVTGSKAGDGGYLLNRQT